MIKRIIRGLYRILLSPEKYARWIGVKIGKGCFISTKKFPAESYLIEIGDYVRIAPETAFYTHGGIWSLRKEHKDARLDHFGKIKVGNYSYIGERCMIMPGVIIGDRCIVGGGSVVSKSVPDGCMVAGNPARYIGKTEDFYQRLKDKCDTKTGGLSDEEKRKILLKLPDEMFESKPYVKTEQ